MKPIEIESWALRVLEQLAKGAQPEGDTVELKAEWPNPIKTARRLAAHANAARGHDILWLIGIDEKRGIVGANGNEFSEWWSQAETQFDGVVPSVQLIVVSWQTKPVAALCFNTDRAPYVVKNPLFGLREGGSVEWEIPWREGAATRSATRNDVLLLLAPLRKAPKVTFLSGHVTLEQGTKQTKEVTFRVRANLYVVPSQESTVVFPYYCASVTVSPRPGVELPAEWITMGAGPRKKLEFGRIALASRNQPHVTVNSGMDMIHATPDDIIIQVPGKIEVSASVPVESIQPDETLPIEVRISLTDIVSEAGVSIACTSALPKPGGKHVTWWLRSLS
jgi:hypothetical protein